MAIIGKKFFVAMGMIITDVSSGVIAFSHIFSIKSFD